MACKAKKVAGSANDMDLTAKKVIRNYQTNQFDKNTINAKLRLKYSGKNSLPNVSASLRLEKDKAIWVSVSKLGFQVAKILITPEEISFYEKINRTYFTGSFTDLSRWLGADLDFKKVQNLLVGEALYDLKKEKFDIQTVNKNYLLTPVNPHPLYAILFYINPVNFKVNSQQITEKADRKSLVINYNDYQSIDNQIFPKIIAIIANDNKYVTKIDVDYKSVEFDKKLSFPFKIPKNYDRVELK
ncbi:MAG: deoxyuridine 5'-triphosphate nucleotidohydrolase [Flavobacteriales bacterium]|nr:MAG: deoxyuridine 5'-triphosphate nucleotidohydrolase [Flavobacteriales bacterium]